MANLSGGRAAAAVAEMDFLIAALEQQGVVFPKLFRRLSEFLAQQQPGGLGAFLPWLAASEEQVYDPA